MTAVPGSAKNSAAADVSTTARAVIPRQFSRINVCGSGAAGVFALLVTDRRCRREYRQHPRFAGRPVGLRQRFRNCSRADRWWFRGEQGFGRLAGPGDLLAIIAARRYLPLSARQDLLRNGDPIRDVGGDSLIPRGTWETVSCVASSKPGALLSSRTA
jgi:hypothetical protein